MAGFDSLSMLFDLGKAVVNTGKDLVNTGKDDYKRYKNKKEQEAIEEEKRAERNARNKEYREERKAYRDSLKKPTLLTDDQYSYQDLANSDIHYAEYLNAWQTGKGKKTFLEPDLNKFDGLIKRQINGNDNTEHKKALNNIYKIFLYNFCNGFPFHKGQALDTTINPMEDHLSYSLSVMSAKYELTVNGIDLFENNAAEKRARELFREYFHDLFERVTDEIYKTAIHSIVTGKTESTDEYLLASMNLIANYNYLLEHPESFVKRGNKNHQEEMRKEEERKKET